MEALQPPLLAWGHVYTILDQLSERSETITDRPSVQNLVIILSDLRLGCLCQTKTIWSIPDPVWCEQLHSKPIRYGLVSPSILFTLYWIDFQTGPKIVLGEHGMNCPLFCRMMHDYMVRFIAPILLYWCYVIGYNVTMPTSNKHLLV